MLNEIQKCKNLDVSEFQIAEQCYWIAWEYYFMLKELVRQAPFKNESEEIEFFREVKPRFTAHMEYFINLVEILLLAENDKCRSGKLWEEEMLRYSRFYRKNQEFIEYYVSGSTSMDRTYFLRSEKKLCNDSKAIVFDADTKFSTSHDGLVRSLLAYKMYMEYIQKKLDEL
jgi:hypothetical protein